MSGFPARVHVILAREARTGLIIRKGPSGSVCTIGWDRIRDTFQIGQWFRGKIYERRCDLSPDGRHFLNFAVNAKWSSEAGGSWTAISRTPWLKAIALWPKGDCWHGGGLFSTDSAFWINRLSDHHDPVQISAGLTAHNDPPCHQAYGGECPGVYYIRLQRDGWRLLHHANEESLDKFSVFEKRLPHGWSLEKTTHATSANLPGKGCYYDTHRLIHGGNKVTLDFPEWEWADFEGERLVWAEAGILRAANLLSHGPGSVQDLCDFNNMKFEAIEAPY